jgi:hypothetical protein
VEVEPFVPPAGADDEMGGMFTTATAEVDADAASGWGEEDDTTFNTWVGHCWIKLP